MDNIVYKPIKQLKPYKKNAKKHPKEQIEQIANSIKEFGFTQPVLIDKNNYVVAGHGRILGAKDAGLKEVPTLCLDDLTEEQIKAYRLADNKLNESEWDKALLSEELEELNNTFDMGLFGFSMGLNEEEKENKYSMKMNIPQYEIKGEEPDISELVDTSKVKELQLRIKHSNVPDEVKQFLKLASYRHLQFNYSKIAEYYAHADKEVQELMEESALVIIDFDDAIKNGYTELMNDLIGMNDDDEEECERH